MSDASSLFNEIRGILEDLEKQIVAKRAEITQLSESHYNSKILMDQITESLTEYKARHLATIEALQQEKAPIEKEVQRLKGEISTLVAQKGELMTETAKLHNANKDFRKYEAGAWKILQAKDAELKERERNIQEKESLKPGAKTFLPPINA